MPIEIIDGRPVQISDSDLFAYREGAEASEPSDISDCQFARGLWGEGIITYDDFLGFIGPGTIPGPLRAIVDALPDDDTGRPTPRKEAIGFLAGAKAYSFGHPLVDVLRQAMALSDPRWTDAYLRDRWQAWAFL